MRKAAMLLIAVLAFAGLVTSACSRGEEQKETAGGQQEAVDEGQRTTSDEHGEIMAEQHESMATTQAEWLKVKKALEEGKTQEAIEPARQMGRAAERLDEFMLHKSPEKKEEFQARANEYRSLVMTLEQHLARGDKKSLGEIAPEIDRACNGCHQSFR